MGNEVLNIFEGFYHGLVFSFPFSVPILICLSRFLLEGFLPGLLASLGTLLGQFCFFFFILNGTAMERGFIQFWYTIEPLLAFVGFVLSFKLATDFMGGSQLRSTGSFGGGNINGGLPLRRIYPFLASFFLMFLNPSMNSTSSRVLLTAGSFFGKSSDSLGVNSYAALPYLLFFSGTFLFCVLLLWPLLITLCVAKGGISERFSRLSQFSDDQNRGTAFESSEPRGGFNSLRGGWGWGALPRGAEPPERSGASRPSARASGPRPSRASAQAFQPVPEARILLSFLLVGCLMSGGFQYSWRLFTQYPASFIDREGAGRTQASFGATSAERTNALTPRSSWVRDFPSFDSNIQHRDKNLPLDRHLPVDKMNSRRVLSGRPPLSEQQKADASLKFQSFFLNTLEEKLENNFLKYRGRSVTVPNETQQSRSGGSPSRSNIALTGETVNPDITEFLLSLKTQGRSFGFFASGEGFGRGSLDRNSDILSNFSPRPLENNTKGKPKYSYIQSQTLNSGNGASSEGAAARLSRDILHDELQVYGALFAKN